MERLQELDILIKDQEKKSDEAWEIASAIIKRANEECRNYLLDLLEQVLEGQAVDLRLAIDDLGGHGSVELRDEEGKNIFGSGFEIYLNSRTWSRDGNANVQFNIGTCGAFGKNDKAQIKKYEMFAKCLQSIEQIENYFLERYYRIVDANKPVRELDNQLNKLKGEKERIERTAKEKEVLESIKVDNLYKNVRYERWKRNQDWKNNPYAKIVEIKSNTINLEVGLLKEGTNELEYTESCRVKKEDFINGIIWGSYLLV